MLQMRVSPVLACLALLAGAIDGNAGEPDAGTDEPRHRFAVGVGHWGALNPLAGAPKDPDTGFFPWVSYENGWFGIDPSGLTLVLPLDAPVMIEGQLAPRWLLIDPADSPAHDDLRRRTGIDLGFRVSLPLFSGILSLGYLADVSGRSDGHEITAEAGYGVPLPGGGQLGIKGGAYWRDADLNTYLYGVHAGEARTDRPAWRIGSRFTPFAGLMVGYPVGRGFEAMFAAEAEYLTGAAASSPIISRRVVPSAFVGLFYTF